MSPLLTISPRAPPASYASLPSTYPHPSHFTPAPSTPHTLPTPHPRVIPATPGPAPTPPAHPVAHPHYDIPGAPRHTARTPPSPYTVSQNTVLPYALLGIFGGLAVLAIVYFGCRTPARRSAAPLSHGHGGEGAEEFEHKVTLKGLATPELCRDEAAESAAQETKAHPLAFWTRWTARRSGAAPGRDSDANRQVDSSFSDRDEKFSMSSGFSTPEPVVLPDFPKPVHHSETLSSLSHNTYAYWAAPLPGNERR
ncbi:hypothetical protein CONPUDRAFT_152848 [Coniophora puteana RWD-64-598 SS2]|uniref:Uncharacterized protein n=1 Tax=Coniophora puteana (strain RWD-64-598) TaxID=741705 RepID=A0A5M3MS96_CONPW|nr:uncharacterized protein CONPUDRAFT_152848 [Coniophora puteana RWD-64-598 SS2]EIW81956.1 hypothetical protein CONPUDRAFT_152848 [Coniophora puteana RWD-64-598 SS2]